MQAKGKRKPDEKIQAKCAPQAPTRKWGHPGGTVEIPKETGLDAVATGALAQKELGPLR